MYGGVQSSMCLPDKGTMTIDAEIQLTVQLVQNSHQNHRKIQAQCSIIKIHASFQDLAVEEVRVKEEKSAISIWKWKKRTSGSARDTGRALALSGISGHMTSLHRRRPNCPQKKISTKSAPGTDQNRQPRFRVFHIQPSSKLLFAFTIKER